MLKGEKIFLDRIEEEDLDLLLKWRNDPENRQWYREYRLLNKEHQKKWWRDKLVNGDGSWNYFLVKTYEYEHNLHAKNREQNKIGVTGIIYVNPVYRTGEIAFTIGEKEYDTKEYTDDILKTVIRYGFNDLNLNRLWIECLEGNPLIHTFSKLGFQKEGELRQTYFKDGKFKNSIIMSLLRGEWNG